MVEMQSTQKVDGRSICYLCIVVKSLIQFLLTFILFMTFLRHTSPCPFVQDVLKECRRMTPRRSNLSDRTTSA